MTILGPLHRNLGEVSISAEPVRLEWVGAYSGSSDGLREPAIATTATCGCTSVSVSPNRPRPGDRVSITADISLARRGPLTSTIHLVDNGEIIAVLSVAATVTASQSLTIANLDARSDEVELLLLWRGGSPPTTVVVERDRTDAETIAIDPATWRRVALGDLTASDDEQGWIWRANVTVPWRGRRGFDPIVTVRAGLVSASRHIQ